MELVTLSLVASGAEIRTAASVEGAIQALATFAPQVIVTDIGMPGRDGYELLRRVRELEHFPSKVPVIVLTAYARREEATRGAEVGFARYLTKPVEPGLLVHTIASVVA